MPNRKESISIALQYPFPEDRVFRYQAMQDVLDVLIDQPYATYSMSELANLTGASQGTISKAVKLLSELDVIETVQDGRTQQVRINRERLTKPDPISLDPQAEFHQPVRVFLQRLQDELDELIGVILFGSVARGEADRASDIDLLVIVDEDRTAARRTVQSVVSDLEDQRFEGNRYTYQPLVESTDSVQRIGDQLVPSSTTELRWSDLTNSPSSGPRCTPMNNDIRDQLVEAERTFEGSPGTIEEGLDVDDAELVQLRRACQLLEVGSNLLKQGYYTVVIESAFVAIERTIQFRLIHDGAMSAAEVISSHRRLYQRGAEIGLYDDAFGDNLAELWNRNRTKTYYRLGIATKEQAEAMYWLADDIHRDLVDMTRVSHECLCRG